jgi:hypothetical protein
MQSSDRLVGYEVGRAGIGIRGVAPVAYEGRHIGTVEFGLNVDQTLLEQLQQAYDVDWQILLSQDAPLLRRSTASRLMLARFPNCRVGRHPTRSDLRTGRCLPPGIPTTDATLL